MLYVGPISVDDGSVRIRLNMYHHLCLTVSIVGTVKLVLPPPSSYPYELMHNCYRRCYLLYALQRLRVDVVVEPLRPVLQFPEQPLYFVPISEGLMEASYSQGE